jgi:glycine/D-amino acid oxidase-like deaminating enzyme
MENTAMGAKRHVIVVGAGIIGASIAWRLAKAGADVTVIAEETGGVATPNSFAWINASWGNPEFYFHFRRRSMAEWKRLAAELPGLPLSWCGSICWDLPADRLEAYAEEHGGWGYGIERIGRAEIIAREPYLTNVPDLAVAIAEEGVIEPIAAARLMLADAEAGGATFVTAAVSGLFRSSERIAGVATSAGMIEADHVVLAAGSGTVALAASAGIRVPVKSAPSFIVHSRPFERRLNGLVIIPGLELRQTIEGRVVGCSSHHDGQAQDEQAEDVFSRLKHMFADADGLKMDHAAIGYRPIPEDGFPIIGNCGYRGLYIAVMHSGVTLAPLAGMLAANEILSGDVDASLAPFRLSRFA